MAAAFPGHVTRLPPRSRRLALGAPHSPAMCRQGDARGPGAPLAHAVARTSRKRAPGVLPIAPLPVSLPPGRCCASRTSPTQPVASPSPHPARSGWPCAPCCAQPRRFPVGRSVTACASQVRRCRPVSARAGSRQSDRTAASPSRNPALSPAIACQ
jgi:hypothetical protein